ncbi:MAG TPA: hypothetical protein VGL38_11110 [bacterium]|jgi:hypothetical protein
MKSLFALLCLLPALLLAQPAPSKPDWSACQFLIGEWTGGGGGSPGQGTGSFIFAPDLQGRVITRKNIAEYPATKDQPAYRHDDLMVIYQLPDHATRADYYDNEGHVIRYGVEFAADKNAVIFLSDSLAGQSRYRLTYTRTDSADVTIRFDVAVPGSGEGFKTYIQATAHKK